MYIYIYRKRKITHTHIYKEKEKNDLIRTNLTGEVGIERLEWVVKGKLVLRF